MSTSAASAVMNINRCPHCEQLFVPSKFHPNQRYCSDRTCRTERKRRYKSEYNRSWRKQNPNYFKEYWLEYREFT